MKEIFQRFGMTAAGVIGAGILLAAPASATQQAQVTVPAAATSVGSDVSVMAIPSGCSGWIDYTDRGRGHINCKPQAVEVTTTVKCTNNHTYTAVGWQYARAECPIGYAAIALSGKAE